MDERQVVLSLCLMCRYFSYFYTVNSENPKGEVGHIVFLISMCRPLSALFLSLPTRWSWLVSSRYPSKHKNNCIGFVQRRPNVFNVGPTVYKYYTKFCFVLTEMFLYVKLARWHSHFATLGGRRTTWKARCATLCGAAVLSVETDRLWLVSLYQ